MVVGGGVSVWSASRAQASALLHVCSTDGQQGPPLCWESPSQWVTVKPLPDLLGVEDRLKQLQEAK